MIARALCKISLEYDTADEETLPHWPCPECEPGHLRLSKGSFRFASAAKVGYGIDAGYLERWEDRGVFTAIMICQNPGCQMGVAVVGDFSLSSDGVGIVPGQGLDGSITRHHTIKAIHPAPKVIVVPEHTPKPIADALERSFPLYWSDPQACAGSMRVAVEEIADHLLARSVDKNGFPVPLTRHLRSIKSSQPQHGEHADAFILIAKKLGNPGAHGGPVERDSLLDAYELLEIELRKLFEGGRRDELISKLTSL